MKRYLYALLVAMVLTTTSCDKDNPTAFSFTNDYAEFTIQVNPTTTQGNIEMGTIEFDTDIQGLVSDNGVSIDNLNSVKIKAVTLTMIDSNSTPYTFDLTNKINAEIGNLSGTGLIEFAKKDPVPTGGLNTIDLDVSDVELLSYFKQSKFKFKLSGFTTAPIDHVFEVKIGLTVKFEGEVIK
ncbi:MAG: hypothetical protein IPJ86_07900 [Bacteroidetes bacterium]|nr:hypothetical protein [Bacteroidota bacterium]